MRGGSSGASAVQEEPLALLDASRTVLPRDPRAAARLAIRAIRAARSKGDATFELRGYWALSNAASIGRRPAAVLAIVDRALQCPAARTDAILRARTKLARGSALIHFGRLKNVRRECREALAAFRSAGDLRGESIAHALLAQAAAEAGRHAEAVNHMRAQRVAMGEDAPAFVLASLEDAEANSRVGLYDFAEALRLFGSAGARFDSIGAEVEAAKALSNRAYVHVKSGRYADALRLYARAADVFERTANTSLIQAFCVDRAELLLEIGATSEARRWTTRALVAAGDSLSVKDRLRTRYLLALATLQDGDVTAAHEAAATVVGEFEHFGDLRGAAEALIVQSAAALAAGDSQEAHRSAAMAVGRFAELRAGAAACAADFALCRADLALHDLVGAESALARAAARPGVSALPWASVELHRNRAVVLAARGDAAGSARLLDRAVRDLDARRALLPPDALRSAFFSRHAPLYREAIDAHVDLGLHDRAFELASASKSRALHDMMMAGGANVDPAEAPRLDRLRTDLGAAYTRLHELALGSGSPRQFDRARLAAARIERELTELTRRAMLDPRASEVAAPPQTSAAIRECLTADEVLVEYSLGSRAIHAFVVTRGGVRRVGLAVDGAELARRLRKFSFHVSAASAGARAGDPETDVDAVRANLKELRCLLIDPLDLPRGARRVIVAPDGRLQGVPFHAMPKGDAWWADESQVLYAPSGAMYAASVRAAPARPGPAHVFAVPDPSVPEIAAEARLIAATLGPDVVVRLGAAADWPGFQAASEAAGVLHIATHGMSRTDSLVGGSVRLADGWLTRFDVYRLRVRADLVVLSACDSGAARYEPSGDSFGLVRGFLCAGARRVVASRWRVDDRATAEWMGEFYGGLAARRPVGEAYLDACRAVRRLRPHPYYWAPFVLMGDPRSAISLSAGVSTAPLGV